MVISEIRLLYRDDKDLLRTVIKRIYEQWDAEREQWDLKKIEIECLFVIFRFLCYTFH